MNILHIPSWFPEEKNFLSGIFIKKQIEAFARHQQITHTVLYWHDTKFASLKNPFNFFSAIFHNLLPAKYTTINNVEYISFRFLDSHQKLFGIRHERLLKSCLRKLGPLRKKRRIDLVHAHVTFPGGLIAQRVAQELSVPYVISEHMGPFPFPEFMSSQDRLEELIVNPIKNCSGIIAVSHHQASEIRKIAGVEALVIPNVVDEKEFFYPYPAIKTVRFTFLIVCIISLQKGLDLLLEAIAILRSKKLSGFVVRVGGKGDLLEKLKKKSREMQLDDLVEWLGEVRRTELIALMHSCDCFISASRWESFGVVLVEALACGKPLIATDSGGPRDIVNEINGILVENENPTALAEAMESMLYGHEKYSPDLIRADYLTKYSTTVIASRYANEVYNPILNKPSLH